MEFAEMLIGQRHFLPRFHNFQFGAKFVNVQFPENSFLAPVLAHQDEDRSVRARNHSLQMGLVQFDLRYEIFSFILSNIQSIKYFLLFIKNPA